jgi:outer membrane receptor protein involved in Fe transport
VLNLFDTKYYDYAIASSEFPPGNGFPATPATIGLFNGYPQPGRNYMVRAGATF